MPFIGHSTSLPFYIHFWLKMLQSSRGCLYVCLSVCVCVCVCMCQLYSPPGSSDFDEHPHKYSLGCFPVPFFSDFENFNLMTSWRPFCTNPLRHSHGCIWTPIFFKFWYVVVYCLRLFGIAFQQNPFTTSIRNSRSKFGVCANMAENNITRFIEQTRCLCISMYNSRQLIRA